MAGKQMDLNLSPDFDGATYDPERDKGRLTKQLLAIRDAMLAATDYHTPAELGAMAGMVEAGTASITARIRDLRKPKFGGYAVSGRPRKNGGGLWEYKIEKPGRAST